MVRPLHIEGQKAMTLTMAKCLNRPLFLAVIISSRQPPPLMGETMPARTEDGIEAKLADFLSDLWQQLTDEEKARIRIHILSTSSEPNIDGKEDESGKEDQSRPWDEKVTFRDVSDHHVWPMIEDAMSLYFRAVVSIVSEAEANSTRGALSDVSLIGLSRVGILVESMIYFHLSRHFFVF